MMHSRSTQITSVIGAIMISYVVPKGHLGLPNKEEVKTSVTVESGAEVHQPA